MNKVLHTAKRRQTLRPVPAAAQGHATDPHLSETYGGESLPVLIRLPDLSPATILPLPNVAEPVCDAEVIRGNAACAAESPVAPQPHRPSSPQLLRRQRELRSQRRTTKREAAGWLHGLGQLAMAAVLAGILLVIVITIKKWNAENAAAGPSATAPITESPQLEFSGPLLESEDGLQPVQGPELGSPSISHQNDQLKTGLPNDPALPTFSAGRSRDAGPASAPAAYVNSGNRPLSSPAAQVVNYAEQYPTTQYPTTQYPTTQYPTTQYPTTGAQPPPASSQIPGPSPNRGWSETISVGQERNAAWPPVDANHLRR